MRLPHCTLQFSTVSTVEPIVPKYLCASLASASKGSASAQLGNVFPLEQFLVLPNQKCQLPQQTRSSLLKTAQLLREPSSLSVKLCVGPSGPTSTPPGSTLPPPGVSLPLCYVSCALEKILQPNYPCPSLQNLTLNFSLAAALLHKFDLLCHPNAHQAFSYNPLVDQSMAHIRF